jgi:hypothetical protein
MRLNEFLTNLTDYGSFDLKISIGLPIDKKRGLDEFYEGRMCGSCGGGGN